MHSALISIKYDIILLTITTHIIIYAYVCTMGSGSENMNIIINKQEK